MKQRSNDTLARNHWWFPCPSRRERFDYCTARLVGHETESCPVVIPRDDDRYDDDGDGDEFEFHSLWKSREL